MMPNGGLKSLGYGVSLLACLFMSMATGCASGGFKLTRQYARFVNQQSIIIRIILYILTSPVFVVTLVIDLLLNNTMDFWEGRVAAGTYKFERDGRSYVAHHEILPGTNLKRSTLQIFDKKEQKQLQELILCETPTGEIELIVDGNLRARVRDISSLPVVSFYDDNGTLIAENGLPKEYAWRK